jgi:hypothetical protein
MDTQQDLAIGMALACVKLRERFLADCSANGATLRRLEHPSVVSQPLTA